MLPGTLSIATSTTWVPFLHLGTMMHYELQEPFDVDHGELDGIPPHQIFTMGVEWEMFRQNLQTGKPLLLTISSYNQARFEKMCERRGRVCQTRVVHDDWCEIQVEAVAPAEDTGTEPDSQ